MATRIVYIILDSQGNRIGVEYLDKAEADAHAARIDGFVTDCEEACDREDGQ